MLSCVWLFATPWTPAHQASLSITNSQSLLKLMSMESVVPSNHLILCHPLHLLPSIFPRTLCSPCRCCSTPGCCCLHSFMSSYLHKFFGKYMLNTLVSWSRKDQSPWLLKTDLSVFLCLFPWLYLLPHLDLQVKPRKPTKNKCFVVYLRIIQKILLLFLVKKINFLKSVLYSLFQPKCEFFFFKEYCVGPNTSMNQCLLACQLATSALVQTLHPVDKRPTACTRSAGEEAGPSLQTLYLELTRHHSEARKQVWPIQQASGENVL